MGRMLEVRHWLVKLNRNLDFMNIDDILVDLKLTPEELEMPVPRYFKLDQSKVRDNIQHSQSPAGARAAWLTPC